MNLTDNEIIKALELCNIENKDCVECPLQNKWDCHLILRNSILDLIIRQKAEIEELIDKLECLLCHATDGKLSKHTYSLKTMELEVTDTMNGTYNEGYDDGIKEFANRLKERIREYIFIPELEFQCDEVDNLMKEMVGDLNEQKNAN